FVFMIRLLPRSTLFPYTTLFRSIGMMKGFFAMILGIGLAFGFGPAAGTATPSLQPETSSGFQFVADAYGTQATLGNVVVAGKTRSEEHTSELQSRSDLVCRLLLE